MNDMENRVGSGEWDWMYSHKQTAAIMGSLFVRGMREAGYHSRRSGYVCILLLCLCNKFVNRLRKLLSMLYMLHMTAPLE